MSEQSVTPEKETEDIGEALARHEKALGISGDYDAAEVLRTFGIDHEIMMENSDWSRLDEKIEAKNFILQQLVMKQMEERRFFSIEPPFGDHTCGKCKGTGEIYKFFRKSVKVNCHICGGKGEVRQGPKVKCPSCKGSGRYVKRWKEGGGINVSCRRCDGEGKIESDSHKCQECLGDGKKSKNVPDHNIKSTTPCRQCGQLGFMTGPVKEEPEHRPKPKTPPARTGRRTLDNPVMPAGLAGKIRDGLPTHKAD